MRPRGTKVANNTHILLLLSPIGVLTCPLSSTQSPSLMKLSWCVEAWFSRSSSMGEQTSWPNDNLLEGAWKSSQEAGKASWNVIIKNHPHMKMSWTHLFLSQLPYLIFLTPGHSLYTRAFDVCAGAAAPWSWWLDTPWFNLSHGPTRKHNGGFIRNDMFYWIVPGSIEILIS